MTLDKMIPLIAHTFMTKSRRAGVVIAIPDPSKVQMTLEETLEIIEKVENFARIYRDAYEQEIAHPTVLQ